MYQDYDLYRFLTTISAYANWRGSALRDEVEAVTGSKFNDLWKRAHSCGLAGMGEEAHKLALTAFGVRWMRSYY